MLEKEKIEEILSPEFAKRVVNFRTDRKIQPELQKINFILFGEYFLTNCSSCIKGAYVKIKTELKMNNSIFQTPKTKIMEGKFQIAKSKKTGISRQIHVGPDVITNDNLTDEKAISLLSQSEGHISLFDKAPENWKELVAKHKAKAKKDSEKKESPKKKEKETVPEKKEELKKEEKEEVPETKTETETPKKTAPKKEAKKKVSKKKVSSRK